MIESRTKVPYGRISVLRVVDPTVTARYLQGHDDFLSEEAKYVAQYLDTVLDRELTSEEEHSISEALLTTYTREQWLSSTFHQDAGMLKSAGNVHTAFIHMTDEELSAPGDHRMIFRKPRTAYLRGGDPIEVHMVGLGNPFTPEMKWLIVGDEAFDMVAPDPYFEVENSVYAGFQIYHRRQHSSAELIGWVPGSTCTQMAAGFFCL